MPFTYLLTLLGWCMPCDYVKNYFVTLLSCTKEEPLTLRCVVFPSLVYFGHSLTHPEVISVADCTVEDVVTTDSYAQDTIPYKPCWPIREVYRLALGGFRYCSIA